MSTPDSVDQLRRDLVSVTSSVSALTTALRDQGEEIAALKIQAAVRDERDKSVKDHLARLDNSFASLVSLGRYFLFAFCTAFISAFVLFVVRGGLSNVAG